MPKPTDTVLETQKLNNNNKFNPFISFQEENLPFLQLTLDKD